MNIEFWENRLTQMLDRELQKFVSRYKIQTGFSDWINFVFASNRNVKIINGKFHIELSIPVWNREKDFLTIPTRCILVLNHQGTWLKLDTLKNFKYLSTVKNGLKEKFPIKVKDFPDDEDFILTRIYNIAGLLCLKNTLNKHKLLKQPVMN